MYSPPVSFLFSAFCCALLFAKAIHLWTYAWTIPVAALVLYLPTFFLPDFLAICVARLFLRPVRGVPSLLGVILGTFFMLLMLCGAASQLGFFFKTGGELEWHEAKTYATTKDGIKMLLTGIWAVLFCQAIILAVAYFVQNLLFTAVGDFLMAIYLGIAYGARYLVKLRHGRGAARQDVERHLDSTTEPPADTDNTDESESHMLMGNGEKPFPKQTKRWALSMPTPATLIKAGVFIFIAVTFVIRPHKPYDYMSVTLPVSMLSVFESEPDECSEMRRVMRNEWPLPHLIDSSKWEEAKGNFKGWAPGGGLADKYRKRRPDWLPKELPRGFSRWDPKEYDAQVPKTFGAERKAWNEKCPSLDLREPFYNPVEDPLKITNLDTDVLQPLKETFDQGNVKIKHVIYVLMESLRGELFPLQQDSGIHKMILDANDEESRQEVNARLAALTPHIERITGVSGNFKDAEGKPYDVPTPHWNDSAAEGFGGINVIGGMTAATMSSKSFAVNHCGAWAMPVEKFEEADTDSYNPCMLQVLDLFNRVKDNSGAENDFREQNWYPALFESMVEEYDRLEVFDQKLGFKHIMTRTQLEKDPRYNKSDPIYQKVNYFGFAEPVLKPYIRDYITNATANNQRMWMTHFTSTTHHAWDTPNDFERTDYLPTGGVNKWHEDFNKYLNTIRFHDAWMGELMQILEDTGIANETLVVFAGDHGQAFKEDCGKQGTYETGHISDFRVPITLRHPLLPRVQYEANATTVSVLPTILDLLINTGSLNAHDQHIAEDLVYDYEGQSLIRPYKASHNGRRAWNFAVINSGAGMMAVTSADVPWRLIMPLGKVIEYTFTDLHDDPMELKPVAAWSVEVLAEAVKKRFGKDAAAWVLEAEQVARWWGLERQRLWRYHV